MKSHICRRCGQDKLINEKNWHRRTASKSGFDLTKCKACAIIYFQSRRDGTWQRRTVIPKPRKVNKLEMACIQDNARRAREPLTSIYEAITPPMKAKRTARGS